jgi:hypothetical protein
MTQDNIQSVNLDILPIVQHLEYADGTLITLQKPVFWWFWWLVGLSTTNLTSWYFPYHSMSYKPPEACPQHYNTLNSRIASCFLLAFFLCRLSTRPKANTLGQNQFVGHLLLSIFLLSRCQISQSVLLYIMKYSSTKWSIVLGVGGALQIGGGGRTWELKQREPEEQITRMHLYDWILNVIEYNWICE